MGMSASQARLLSLTARLSDLERASESISNAKMRLATKSQEASDKYMTALDNDIISVLNPDNKSYVEATAYNLTNYAAISTADTQQRFLKSNTGAVLITEAMAKTYEASGNDPEKFLNQFGYTPFTPAQITENINTLKSSATSTIQGMLSTIESYNTLVTLKEKAKNANTNAAGACQATDKKGETYGRTVISANYNAMNLSGETAFRNHVKSLSDDNKRYYDIVVNQAKLARESVETLKAAGGTAEQIKTAEDNATKAEALIEKAKTNYDIVNYDVDRVDMAYCGDYSKRQISGDGQLILEIANIAQEIAGYSKSNAYAAKTTADKAVNNAEAPTLESLQASGKELSATLSGLDIYYSNNDLTTAIQGSKGAGFASNISALKNLTSYLSGLSTNLNSETGTIANSSSYDYPYKYDATAVNYYLNLFEEIGESGYVTASDKNMNDTEWLEQQLKSGNLTMALWDKDAVEKDGSLGDAVNKDWETGDNTIITKDDERAIARAEAEYEATMADIAAKEERFDTQLKAVDTEHSAIQTEMEATQKLVDKNIERTFKFFQA